MKITLSTMKFSKVTDHFEIINETFEADKIILDTQAKRYEISVDQLKGDKLYGFPNQFIRCLVLIVKDGKKTSYGYFTKIALFLNGNDSSLGIISLEETYYKEDVDLFFKKEYANIKKVERIDVQTISIEDFIIQSKISLMKEARKLFKRRRNANKKN